MKHKETYDRAAVGLRLKTQRKRLDWSRRYVAGQIGLVEKYYADIERGTCGMSIETMIALADLYQFSLDEFIYGSDNRNKDPESSLEEQIRTLPPQEQEYCTELVRLFIKGIQNK